MVMFFTLSLSILYFDVNHFVITSTPVNVNPLNLELYVLLLPSKRAEKSEAKR